jgi:hypothetical protein
MFGRGRSVRARNLVAAGCVMRATVLFALSVGLSWAGFQSLEPAAAAQKDAKKDEKKDVKKDAKAPAKDYSGFTPAAQLTFNKSLKAKMTAAFTEARLGDVLKEFAHLVDTKADTLLLWTYGPGFPYAQKVSYTCKDKPLEVALDELFTKVGGLGYIVVSKDGDRHDGWIRVTTTGERGTEKGVEPPPKATEAEEMDATDKLGLAKKLIDAGKNEQAKTVLTFVINRYPGAKATTEAKELLAKLEK